MTKMKYLVKKKRTNQIVAIADKDGYVLETLTANFEVGKKIPEFVYLSDEYSVMADFSDEVGNPDPEETQIEDFFGEMGQV